MLDTLPEISPDVEAPKGRYVVELTDDRGKVVERVESENYITPLWEVANVAAQYLGQWHAQHSAAASAVYTTPDALLTSATGPWYSSALWSPFAQQALPMDSVFCTNDTTAEDTAEHWLRGTVIAWATRWKSTVSASGLRGQINEAECAFSGAGLVHKTVWDFTTQQGNGTFQTVGIGAAVQFGNPTAQCLWTGAGPASGNGGLLFGSNMDPVYTAATGMMSNLWIDSTGKVYFVGHASNSATANVAIYSLPATIWTATQLADSTYDNRAAVRTTEVASAGIAFAAAPSVASTSASPNNTTHILGLVRLGDAGDFVISYIGQNGGSSTSANGRQVRLRRITAAGALVYDVAVGPLQTVNPSTTSVCSLVYDGTYLYSGYNGATTTQAVAANVYRVAATDGTSSAATIALPSGTYHYQQGYGMTLTGQNTGDLLIDTQTAANAAGIIRMTTAGVLASPYNYGRPFMSAPQETALSPFTTTANYFRPAFRGYSSTGPHLLSGYTGFTAGGSQSFAFDKVTMLTKGGKLYLFAGVFANARLGAVANASIIPVIGANCFSRTLLGAPVTKTSAQNMKISYELTFPTPWHSARYPTHRSL